MFGLQKLLVKVSEGRLCPAAAMRDFSAARSRCSLCPSSKAQLDAERGKLTEVHKLIFLLCKQVYASTWDNLLIALLKLILFSEAASGFHSDLTKSIKI